MPILHRPAFLRKLGRAEGDKKAPRFPLQRRCMAWHWRGCLLRLGAGVQKRGHFTVEEAKRAAAGALRWQHRPEQRPLLLCASLHAPISRECGTVRRKADGRGRRKCKWLPRGHGQSGHCANMFTHGSHLMLHLPCFDSTISFSQVDAWNIFCLAYPGKLCCW